MEENSILLYKEAKNTPGIGQYNVSIEKKKANYILSNYKSQLPKSFLSEQRDKVNKSTNFTPGPGSYNLGTDFK